MSSQGGSKGLRMRGSEYKEIAKRMRQVQQQQRLIVENMKRIRYKVAVLSSKGGVGKSFVTATLAAALAVKGRSVGILDADMHGPSIPRMLGLPLGTGLAATQEGMIIPAVAEPGIKVVSLGLMLPGEDTPVIWRGAIKTSAIRELLAYTSWGNLDYLLIDLPPGTGDEQLTITQIIPGLTGFILVTIPSEVSKYIVKKAVVFAKKVGVPVVGVVENMSYYECSDGTKHYIFGRGAASEIAEQYGIRFLGEIPIDPVIRESNDRGRVFFLDHEDSKAAKAFMEIADRFIEAIEDNG